mmetsp:Transcript_37859/g.94128  ORF Transcript_37859/g.94128 Transcript_37859/m.94128 type:complete len:225 (-) Transcript_37859:171-845(-)
MMTRYAAAARCAVSVRGLCASMLAAFVRRSWGARAVCTSRAAIPSSSPPSSNERHRRPISPFGAPTFASGASACTNVGPGLVRHDGGDVVCAREVTSSEGAAAVTFQYVLGMRPSAVASRMNHAPVVFVDLPSVGQQLLPGRPFAMVEAEGHLMVTLESPVTGEVVEVNQRLHLEPGLVGSGGSTTRDGGEGGGVGEGWLVKVEPFLDPNGGDDPDFATMCEGE